MSNDFDQKDSTDQPSLDIKNMLRFSRRNDGNNISSTYKCDVQACDKEPAGKRDLNYIRRRDEE